MNLKDNKSQKNFEVLYQKLGNSWYVFSIVNNKVIYSALPAGIDPKKTKLELHNILEEHMTEVIKMSSQFNVSP